MKQYTKPMIAEAELFTQDAIAVSIPKTRYKVGNLSERELVAYTLGSSETISAMTGSKYNRK